MQNEPGVPFNTGCITSLRNFSSTRLFLLYCRR